MADEGANMAGQAFNAAVLELSASASTSGFSITLKIDYAILAGLVSVGVLSFFLILGLFCTLPKYCDQAPLRPRMFGSAWKRSQPFIHVQLNIRTEEIVVGCM